MTIEEMQLTPFVAAKAEALEKAYPSVVFLSGRRTLAAQAVAMAANVARNRRYIEDTYVSSVAITRLQAWLNAHPSATTVEEIAAGLLAVMTALPEALRNSISRHLTGQAFDLEPNSVPIAAVEALNPQRFLQHEAGLLRWHVSF